MTTDVMSIIGVVNGYALASCLVYLCVAVPMLAFRKMRNCFAGIPYYAWAGFFSAVIVVSAFVTVAPIH